MKLDRIADLTHGFVGADLAALTREAAMNAIRRLLPELDLEVQSIPADILNRLIVTGEDFTNALREMTPSALREVFIESPNIHWSDIGGLPDAKQELKEAVEWPMKYPNAFQADRSKTAKRYTSLWSAWNRKNHACKSGGYGKRGKFHKRERA